MASYSKTPDSSSVAITDAITTTGANPAGAALTALPFPDRHQLPTCNSSTLCCFQVSFQCPWLLLLVTVVRFEEKHIKLEITPPPDALCNTESMATIRSSLAKISGYHDELVLAQAAEAVDEVQHNV
jgi:hypothetical protein